tara:strand:- start:1732 stop:2304 length:573 start_codon:yes stop_codon:yes gene_type:complete
MNLDRKQLWQELASSEKGQLINKVRQPTVAIPYQNWQIVCQISSHNKTRIWAAFSAQIDLHLKIYRPLIWGYLAKWLFAIPSGSASLDQNLVVTGNHSDKIQQLLDSDALVESIEANILSSTNLKIKNYPDRFAHFPDNVDQLYFQCQKIIIDLNWLNSLIDLFRSLLNRLTEIGVAYPRAVSSHLVIIE